MRKWQEVQELSWQESLSKAYTHTKKLIHNHCEWAFYLLTIFSHRGRELLFKIYYYHLKGNTIIFETFSTTLNSLSIKRDKVYHYTDHE